MKTKAPLSFALAPCGFKLGASGTVIDFDALYNDLIATAIIAAGNGSDGIRGGPNHQHVIWKRM